MVWPVHPQPQKDELLSSWMVRTAHGNCYKVHDFYCQYLGRDRQIWNRDIDHFAPDWLLSRLSFYSGLSYEQLNNMTLRSYRGVVFDQFNETGVTRGILALGIFHRVRKLYGQQFCPLCLMSDAKPYLRKKWRIACICICDVHHLLLHDRCHKCENTMMPHRADMHSKYGFPRNTGISYCGVCGIPLTTHNKDHKLSQSLINLQHKIYEGIESGSVLVGNELVAIHEFLEGVRALATGAARLYGVKEQLKLDRIVFEKSAIDLRYYLLSIVSELIEDWPTGIILLSQSFSQTKFNIVSKNTNGTVPRWLTKAL